MEGHEDTHRRYRDEIRERERFAKQQIQHGLGADLSKLTSYEYGLEILQEMERVEVRIMLPETLDFQGVNQYTRPRHYLMLLRSIYRQRFSGSCVHTSLTS